MPNHLPNPLETRHELFSTRRIGISMFDSPTANYKTQTNKTTVSKQKNPNKMQDVITQQRILGCKYNYAYTLPNGDVLSVYIFAIYHVVGQCDFKTRDCHSYLFIRYVLGSERSLNSLQSSMMIYDHFKSRIQEEWVGHHESCLGRVGEPT